MDLKLNNDVPARTSGDGMEQEEMGKVLGDVIVDQIESKTKGSSFDQDFNSLTESRKSSISSLPIPGLHTLYRRTCEYQSRSLPPVIPKGKLIILTPKLIKSSVIPEHKKNRPPKFIPFEPYIGAVNPIIPVKTKCKRIKKNRNNLDLNVLVTQMSTIKTYELNSTTVDSLAQIKDENDKSVEQSEMNDLNNEMKKLKDERDYFQSQMKFQIQVNTELKNLLVASVGEDLQTRVNVLTEDKLQLARALLDTANNLSTHTEQIEFLAGQCEVWRSKFLASSVMIEELARWKADLTHKNSLLTNSNKQMLILTGQLRDMQIEMLKNIKFLSNLKTINLPSSDIISLTSECLNICQQMVLHTGVGIPEEICITNLNTLCENEKQVYQALESVSQPLMATDEAFKAIVGHAQRPYKMMENKNVGTNQTE